MTTKSPLGGLGLKDVRTGHGRIKKFSNTVILLFQSWNSKKEAINRGIGEVQKVGFLKIFIVFRMERVECFVGAEGKKPTNR